MMYFYFKKYNVSIEKLLRLKSFKVKREKFKHLM